MKKKQSGGRREGAGANYKSIVSHVVRVAIARLSSNPADYAQFIISFPLSPPPLDGYPPVHREKANSYR
jgi:hypothetical protein